MYVQVLTYVENIQTSFSDLNGEKTEYQKGVENKEDAFPDLGSRWGPFFMSNTRNSRLTYYILLEIVPLPTFLSRRNLMHSHAFLPRRWKRRLSRHLGHGRLGRHVSHIVSRSLWRIGWRRHLLRLLRLDGRPNRRPRLIYLLSLPPLKACPTRQRQDDEHHRHGNGNRNSHRLGTAAAATTTTTTTTTTAAAAAVRRPGTACRRHFSAAGSGRGFSGCDRAD